MQLRKPLRQSIKKTVKERRAFNGILDIYTAERLNLTGISYEKDKNLTTIANDNRCPSCQIGVFIKTCKGEGTFVIYRNGPFRKPIVNQKLPVSRVNKMCFDVTKNYKITCKQINICPVMLREVDSFEFHPAINRNSETTISIAVGCHDRNYAIEVNPSIDAISNLIKFAIQNEPKFTSPTTSIVPDTSITVCDLLTVKRKHGPLSKVIEPLVKDMRQCDNSPICGIAVTKAGSNWKYKLNEKKKASVKVNSTKILILAMNDTIEYKTPEKDSRFGALSFLLLRKQKSCPDKGIQSLTGVKGEIIRSTGVQVGLHGVKKKVTVVEAKLIPCKNDDKDCKVCIASRIYLHDKVGVCCPANKTLQCRKCCSAELFKDTKSCGDIIDVSKAKYKFSYKEHVTKYGKHVTVTFSFENVLKGRFRCEFSGNNMKSKRLGTVNCNKVICQTYIKSPGAYNVKLIGYKNKKSKEEKIQIAAPPLPKPIAIIPIVSKTFDFVVKFDGPFDLDFKNRDCYRSYAMMRGNQCGIKRGHARVNNKICFKNNCLRQVGTRTKRTDQLCLDLPPVQCKIKGPSSISTCQNLKVYAEMDGLSNVDFSIDTNDNLIDKPGINQLNQLLVLKRLRRGEAKRLAVLKSNKLLKAGYGIVVKINATDKHNNNCLRKLNVTVTSEAICHCFFKRKRTKRNRAISYIIQGRSKVCNNDIDENAVGSVVIEEDGKVVLTKILPNIGDTYEINEFNFPPTDVKRVLSVKYISYTEAVGVPRADICESKPVKVVIYPRKISMKIKRRTNIRCGRKKLSLKALVKNLPANKKSTKLWEVAEIGEDGVPVPMKDKADNIMVFPDDDILQLNLTQDFECGKNYTYAVTCKIDGKIVAAAKGGFELPQVAPPSIEARVIFKNGSIFVKAMTRAKLEFYDACNEDSDEDCTNFGNFTDISTGVRELKLRDKIGVVRLLKVDLTKYLIEGSKYLLGCRANKSGVEITKVVSVSLPPQPINCELSCSPDEGTATETLFTCTTFGCSIDSESTDDEKSLFYQYDLGSVNGIFVNKPSTENTQNFILPPGTAGNGYLNIRVKVGCDSVDDCQSVILNTAVKVNATEKTNEVILKELYDAVVTAVAEGKESLINVVELVKVMMKTLQQRRICFTEVENVLAREQIPTELSKGLSIDEDDIVNIAKQLVKASVAVGKSECNETEIPISFKELSAKFSSVIYQKKTANNRRKRRAISNDDETTDLMTYEEMLDFIALYSNILFPITYNENVTNNKVFTSNIELSQKSLSSYLVSDPSNSKIVTSSNIALLSHRITNVTAMGNVALLDDEIMFNDKLSNSYNYWECSEVSQCEGFFLTAMSMKGDLYSVNDTGEDLKLVSNIVLVNLINPVDEGEDSALYNVITDPLVSESMTVSLMKKENVTGNVICHVWEQNMWMENRCSEESISNESITCKCNTNGPIALFEVPITFVAADPSTVAPKTTSMVSTASSYSNSSAEVNVNTTSATRNNTMASTNAITNNSNSATNTPTQTTVLPNNTESVKVSFSLNVDFNSTKASFAAAGINMETKICSQSQTDLGYTQSEVKECRLEEGSIVVIIILHLKSDSVKDALQRFGELVQTNGFSIAFPNGTSINTITDSAQVNGKKHTVNVSNKDDDDDDDNVIIIAVVSVVIILVIIAAVIVFVLWDMKRKARKIVPSPLGSPLTVTNKKEPIKTETRSAAGIDNPTYEE